MAEILKLLGAAILGGLITTAISWLKLGGKIRVLNVNFYGLKKAFDKCYNDHLSCPDLIKDECQENLDVVKRAYEERIKKLADTVKDLTQVAGTVTADFQTHLKLSQQLDTATEQRFKRVEIQLTRIESKLDQLKGWHLVKEEG